jgi:hypothetical protein
MRAATLIISLLSVGLCGCCTTTETDRELNGLIRNGWLVSVSDSPIGVYPVSLYCTVNAKLPTLIQNYTGDARSDCFLVPRGSAYDIVVLSHERLSEKTMTEIHGMIRKAISEAEADAQASPGR